MKNLLITILLIAILFCIKTIKSQPVFEPLDGKINLIWNSLDEMERDGRNPRSSVPVDITPNYYQHPEQSVADSVFYDSLLLADFQNDIEDYITDSKSPPFFVEEAVLYRSLYDSVMGYYLAYYCNDTLIVLSGDSSQYHFTVKGSSASPQDIIATANAYFDIDLPDVSSFEQDEDWHLKSEFTTNGKPAELRGYNREFVVYKTIEDLTKAWEESDKREIPVVELVIYNE